MTSKKAAPPPTHQHPPPRRPLFTHTPFVGLKYRHPPQPQHFLTPSLLRRRRQCRSLIRILFIATLLGIFFFLLRIYTIYSSYLYTLPDSSTTIDILPSELSSSSSSPRLHLLIPVTAPSLLFCKSLASAILNSYPPPILINFNSTFSNPAFARGAKLAGVADYLSNFPLLSPMSSNHIDLTSDLVLITDGFDVWFQLPPPLLLHRYLAHFAPGSVVFGADKLCWPNAASSAACRLAPESTLPKAVYGVNQTDNDPAGYRVRPRYLNSGTVLGGWREVRKVYERAKKVGEGKRGKVWSDQGVLAEVWGGEVERKMRESTDEKESRERDGGKGLGIVMDYESELFMTMTHAHGDLKWGRVNITTSVDINSDLYLARTHLPALLPNQLELFLAQNIISNSTPALLHFNGMKFPLGNNKDTGWWDRMWWFNLPSKVMSNEDRGRTAKQLFERHVEMVRRWGDGVDYNNDKVEAKAGRKYGGVWTDKGVWMEWGEVCGEWDFVGRGGVWGV